MSAISSLKTRLPRCVTFTPLTWSPGRAGRLMLSSVSFGKSLTSTMRLSSDRRPSLCISSTSRSPPAYDTDVLEMHKDGLRSLRSEEHTSELQSRLHLVCRLLLEKKKKNNKQNQKT